MLQIDLTIGDVRVTSDEFNYIVHVHKVKQKGKDAGTGYWAVEAYHSTLPQVAATIARLAAEGVKTPGTEVFDKVQALLDKEQARINKLLEKKAK